MTSERFSLVHSIGPSPVRGFIAAIFDLPLPDKCRIYPLDNYLAKKVVVGN
jgi:hypothetical protein